MNHRHYVSRKSIGWLLPIFAAFFLNLLPSVGSGACPGQTNLVEDTKKLLAKIKEDLGQDVSGLAGLMTNSRQEAPDLNDNVLHMVDRSHPFLKQLDSVGVITGTPYKNVLDGFKYGSAVLINSCYILTNEHVMHNIGKSLEGDVSNFSVGQQQSCDSQYQFQHLNIEATLVAIGARAGGLVRNDWALLKVDSAKTIAIKPTEISTIPLKINALAIRVGFPADKIGKGSPGFSHSWAQYVKTKMTYPEGLVEITDNSIQHGISGGGAFIIDFDQNYRPVARLTGIYADPGIFIDILSLFERLRTTHPSLHKKVIDSNKTGRCD